MALRAGLFFTLLIGIIFFLPSTPIVVAQVCPGYGEVEITPETRAAATAAGIPGNQRCWNPKNPNVGAHAGEAKVYLKSILCTADKDNYGGHGPDGTIEQLNPKFAECAAKFLKAASAQVQGSAKLRSGQPNSICIREGARTVAKQNEYVSRGVIACKRGAACEHPSGIAIDVNTSSDDGYRKLHQLAPQFSMNFYLPVADKYHFVPKGADCSSAGFRPNDPTANVPPTSQFANTIRQALGMQQAQPQLAPQSAFPQQPISNTQSPTNAFNATLPTPSLLPESSSLGTASPGATVSSVADKLEELTFDVKATSSSPAQSATNVPLIINRSDVGGVRGSTPQLAQSTSTTNVGSSMVQQTFVSKDLHQSAPPTPTTNSRAIQILSQLKTVLLKMLEYLQPFSSRSIYQTETYE